MHKDGRILNNWEDRIYDTISNTKYLKYKKKTEEKLKEVWMFVVQRRDAKTLMPDIIRNVNQKTEIYSDEWHAFKKYLSMNLNILL